MTTEFSAVVYACRFGVLVAGTLIYGRGDEVEEKAILEELGAEEAVAGTGAIAEEAAAGAPSSAAQPAAIRPSRSVSGRLASGASRPIMMGTPSSMKVLVVVSWFEPPRGTFESFDSGRRQCCFQPRCGAHKCKEFHFCCFFACAGQEIFSLTQLDLILHLLLQSTMNMNMFRGSYIGSMPRSYIGSYGTVDV